LVSNEKKSVWARVSRHAARKQKACGKQDAEAAVFHDCPLPKASETTNRPKV
jgi:hypothetical protein